MQKRALVVDDSPTVVKFVSFCLKNAGFEVITACDGMDAMEKVSQVESPVDLVVTDLNMPNVDGYTLIQTLRGNCQYAGTPIVILSSEEADTDKERGISVGATAYLVKPFKSSALVDIVSQYVR